MPAKYYHMDRHNSKRQRHKYHQLQRSLTLILSSSSLFFFTHATSRSAFDLSPASSANWPSTFSSLSTALSNSLTLPVNLSFSVLSSLTSARSLLCCPRNPPNLASLRFCRAAKGPKPIVQYAAVVTRLPLRKNM